MLRLAMVSEPVLDDRLATIKQIGVDHLVHYDMANARGKYDHFTAYVDRAARFGLTVPVVEAGPPIDRVILGKSGADEQIAIWKAAVPRLARAGVKVICYNFMPQVTADAMVVRTSFDTPTRGGALTSAFRLADVGPETVRHEETAVPPEQMWTHLETFLAQVLPVAEEFDVRLAMHPDDPPLSPLCGLDRIMNTIESFERLLAVSPSRANGMTLCIGCFAELGADIPALIERHATRMPFVHVRSIAGELTDFIETFPDDGDVDLAGIMAELVDRKVEAYIRPDHAPLLEIEAQSTEGYGFLGHMFTMGYIKGLLAGQKVA